MADYAKEIRDLPFKIMPGEDSSLRSSIFLELSLIHIFIMGQNGAFHGLAVYNAHVLVS